MKFLIVLVLILIFLTILFGILYLIGRWIYRTWLSDHAADKAELKALLEEINKLKTKG